MRTRTASVRDECGPGSSMAAIRDFEAEWRTGEPDIDRYAANLPSGNVISTLASLVKAEIRARFARDEQVTVAEYLERFPVLREDKERVVSLVYEEYCLREERGEALDTEVFCDQYAPWKDSLICQLRYHRVLSQVAGVSFSPPRYPIPGDQFEKFLIRSVIGKGGAARVYLAEQTDMGNREVALKVSADRGSEPSILGRLQHPHIVRVLTSARPPGSQLLGLCMQYLPGLPLDEVIKVVDPASHPTSSRVLRDAARQDLTVARPPIPETTATGNRSKAGAELSGWAGFPSRGSYCDGVAWVIKTLAEALAYAHGQDVLHLDVKPANVLLTVQGGPQLLDFNLSHDPHTAEQAEAALRGGTLPYMAPEQLEAFLDPGLWSAVSPSADVYSLGLLASEMITGKPPEAHDPTLPRARAIRDLLERRRDLRLDLRSGYRGIPHSLVSIIDRCVAFEPADRYTTASQVAEDLDRFLQRRPLKFAANVSVIERGSFWLKRNIVAVASTTLVMIAVGIFMAVTLPERALKAAIRDYDLKHYAQASDEFKALGGFKGSVLVRFYETAGMARKGVVLDALGPLSTLLKSTSVVDELTAKGKNHPAFASHVEDLCALLLAELEDPKFPSIQREPLLDYAEALARLALSIDSRRDLARMSLATIHENRANYVAADAILDTLVAENKSSNLPEDRLKHWSARFARARCLAGRARSLSSIENPDPEQLDQAQALAGRTFDDLDVLRKKFTPLSALSSYKLDYIRIEALVALSDIARRRSQHQEAIAAIRKAREYCDKNELYAHDFIFFQALCKNVDKRLESLKVIATPPQLSSTK